MTRDTFYKIIETKNITWNDMVIIQILSNGHTYEYIGAIDLHIDDEYVSMCVKNDNDFGTLDLTFEYEQIISIKKLN